MIEFISSWAEQIIVAVIIATIIEMIIPKGNNKKYIKVVIGVYILFTIIAPVIQKVSGKEIKLDMDYNKYFNNTKEYETMSSAISATNNQNIGEIYVQNLKNDIKSKVKEKGYEIENLQVEIDLEDTATYGNINKMSMNLKEIIKNEASQKKQNNIIINKVNIGNTTVNTATNSVAEQKSIDENKKKEIKEYLSSIYSLNTKYIIIN